MRKLVYPYGWFFFSSWKWIMRNNIISRTPPAFSRSLLPTVHTWWEQLCFRSWRINEPVFSSFRRVTVVGEEITSPPWLDGLNYRLLLTWHCRLFHGRLCSHSCRKSPSLTPWPGMSVALALLYIQTLTPHAFRDPGVSWNIARKVSPRSISLPAGQISWLLISKNKSSRIYYYMD